MATETMRPGDRIPMSWDEYEEIGEFWGEYVDGRLIAGPLRTGTHQDIVLNVTTILVKRVEPPLHAIHQWGWKVGGDEFIPDAMVFDEPDREDRLTTVPRLVVEVLSTDLATDFLRKTAKYAAAGLRQLCIIDPDGPEVVVLQLIDGTLQERGRFGPGTEVTFHAGAARITFDPATLLG